MPADSLYISKDHLCQISSNQSISLKSSPGAGEKWEGIQKPEKQGSEGMLQANFGDDRTIFRHLKIRGTESGTYIQIYMQTYLQNFSFYCCFGVVGG